MSSSRPPSRSTGTSRSQQQPEPTLEDTIAELIDPPAGPSESKIILDKIQKNSSDLEETSAYANQLSQYWHSSEVSPDDLQKVKARLVDDALNVNALVEDQSKLANQTANVHGELNDAWDAAQTNLDIAMKLYHKAKLLPNQETELRGMQARIAALENEKSTKDLLLEREEKLLDRISSTAAEKQELTELRAKTLVSDAEREELKGLRIQTQNTITDLNSTVKGIKDTTDQIAQAMNEAANASQSTNEQKRRSTWEK